MDGTKQKLPSDIELVIANIHSGIEALNDKAERICKKHFDFVMGENRRKGWDDKSILYAKPRVRDNTLTITWHEVRWYGSLAAKTRRMEKKVIIKPKRGHGYNMKTLLKKAQPWEAEMVSEVEQALIPIRREVYFLSKAITYLNMLTKEDRDNGEKASKTKGESE